MTLLIKTLFTMTLLIVTLLIMTLLILTLPLIPIVITFNIGASLANRSSIPSPPTKFDIIE